MVLAHKNARQSRKMVRRAMVESVQSSAGDPVAGCMGRQTDKETRLVEA